MSYSGDINLLSGNVDLDIDISSFFVIFDFDSFPLNDDVTIISLELPNLIGENIESARPFTFGVKIILTFKKIKYLNNFK